MAISMAIVRPAMEARGLRKINLRRIDFNPSVIDKVLAGKPDAHRLVDTVKIKRLCAVLECRPVDIIEFLPDGGRRARHEHL